MELLRDLPRSSPLSEWKFFVRGLAAFYRGDDGGGEDQLGPARPQARGLPDRGAAPSPGLDEADRTRIRPTWSRWRSSVFGEPVLDRLRQLRQLWWPARSGTRSSALLGPLRQSLHRIDPKLAERLTVRLDRIDDQGRPGHGTATRPSALVTRVHPGRPSRWRSTRAGTGSGRWSGTGPRPMPGGAIHYWIEYIEDLETIAPFNPSERALAQAMVWNHLAELHQRGRRRSARRSTMGRPTSPFGPPGAVRSPGRRTTRRSPPPRRPVVGVPGARASSWPPSTCPPTGCSSTSTTTGTIAKGLEAAARRLLATFPDDVGDPRRSWAAIITTVATTSRRPCPMSSRRAGSSRSTIRCASSNG